MAEDRAVKQYFEHMPYGNDAKASEVFGKHNQVYINRKIADLVRQYDAMFASGDKENSQLIASTIKSIARQLNQLKEIKKEFAVSYGGGTGGKNLFSNYTDLRWDKAFFTDMGVITFGPGYRLQLTAPLPDGTEVTKDVSEITTNWVIKSTEEADYMRMHQDLVGQGQTSVKHPDFNIDWAVDKLLIDNDAWKIFVSDKIGGIYFLHVYLQEHKEAFEAGEIPDEMMHPDSFHPEQDTRLHKHYADRLKKAFDPNYKTIRDGNTSSSHVSGRTTLPEKPMGLSSDQKMKRKGIDPNQEI